MSTCMLTGIGAGMAVAGQLSKHRERGLRLLWQQRLVQSQVSLSLRIQPQK